MRARRLLRWWRLHDQLTERVKAAAVEAGFDLVGVARVSPPVPDRAEERYARWIAEGMHGAMAYLERGLEKRLHPDLVLPGVRSVVALAASYNVPGGPPPAELRISRYAWGDDYHELLLPRVRRVEAAIAAEAPGVRTRGYVDTGPVLEKVWAWRAGIGWIGKNGCLITTRFGSWVFLAVVLTTLELEPDEPHADRCGSCADCLEICPTDAFAEPRIVDSRRCVSYTTIEHRGVVPPESSEGTGNRLFGCDDCQDVCPWNRDATTIDDPRFAWRPGWRGMSAYRLLGMNEDEIAELRRGSPIARSKRTGLLRNAAVIAGNRGDARAIEALKGAREDRDEVVRAQAEEALRAISRRGSAPRRHLRSTEGSRGSDRSS